MQSQFFVFLLLVGTSFTARISQGQDANVGPRQLFAFCDKKSSEMTETEWAQLDAIVRDIKSSVESKCKEIPYEFKERVASPSLFQTLPNAGPGTQSSWNKLRKFFVTPPIAEKSGSGISGCALVLNGDLNESAPGNRSGAQREQKIWDGSIRNSVVVVNGSISISGYIYDSVVIARGTIHLKGYIYNSLVISCDEGEATSVDCSDGYVSRAIVIAKQLKPGSARQCATFGNSNTEDHRGDQVMEWAKVLDVINATGSRELPPLIAGDKQNLIARATGESLLQELLAQSEITRGTILANELSEFSLDRSQVKRLIAAAKESESKIRRRLLWHAIRMSQDSEGLEFLTTLFSSELPKADVIDFIQSYGNPSLADVPLLIAIYSQGAKAEKEAAIGKKLEKKDTFGSVTSKVMDLFARDWSTLVSEFRPEYGAPDSLQLRARNIVDRRKEEAYATRDDFARWLISNGTQDEHRINAFRLASMQPWPRSNRITVTQQLAEELLHSSEDPRFRAKVIPLISNFMAPETFLSRTAKEVDVVRIAAVKAIANRILEAWNSPSMSMYLQQYEPILQRLAKEDESGDVRKAAEEILADINFRKRIKE